MKQYRSVWHVSSIIELCNKLAGGSHKTYVQIVIRLPTLTMEMDLFAMLDRDFLIGRYLGIIKL